MATSLKLTRNQLASFLKDPEQIKQFERLILLVNDYLNSGEVAGLSDTLGSVIAATNANAARLQDVIDTLDKAPRYEAVQDDPCCPPPVDLAPVLDRLQALELAPPILPPTASETPSGGGYTVTTTSSSSYTETATSGDKVIILTSSTAVVVNVTLPSAVGNTARLTFKRSSTAAYIYALVITAAGAETIDGSATFTAPLQYAAITLISDNANWYVI